MTMGEIASRFTYHAPKGDQPERYEGIRAKARLFALSAEKRGANYGVRLVDE